MGNVMAAAARALNGPAPEPDVLSGSLDESPEVQAAMQAVADAREAVASARADYDEQANKAQVHTQVRERRIARVAMGRAREHVEDCAAKLEDARAALGAAREQVYSRKAPGIASEFQRRLPPLEAALQQALDAAMALQRAELAAAAHTLVSPGSYGGGRSPVNGAASAPILTFLQQSLSIISRVRTPTQ
jgi:hypothetical protein